MKGLLSLLISSMIFPVHAGMVIFGTRIICPAEQKEVMVQLMNQGNRSSLMQAWIDDGDTSLPPEKDSGSFHVNATSSESSGQFWATNKN
ncbi:chaperone protein [Escherichia coli]|uniref:Chaperone protein n=1 Tax=Escherichia coli TaxID=562 RepID=A0A376WX36_ECOLX|nr:chaperone protein [Escherichia coli]